MQYSNLGQTGLKVSRICLGMMTYGSSKWRDWVLDDADARQRSGAHGSLKTRCAFSRRNFGHT